MMKKPGYQGGAQLLIMNVAARGHEVMLWQRLQLRLRLRLH